MLLSRVRSIAVLIVLALGALPASAQTVLPTIWIGPNARDGFIDMDAGIRDSIRDIKLQVPATQFRLAPSRETATLVLVVMGRGVVTNGSVGFSSAQLGIGVVVPNQTPTLATLLRVGEYERVFQSEGGTWGGAAEAVMKDVLAWWDANREAVRR